MIYEPLSKTNLNKVLRIIEKKLHEYDFKIFVYASISKNSYLYVFQK